MGNSNRSVLSRPEELRGEHNVLYVSKRENECFSFYRLQSIFLLYPNSIVVDHVNVPCLSREIERIKREGKQFEREVENQFRQQNLIFSGVCVSVCSGSKPRVSRWRHEKRLCLSRLILKVR